MPTQYRVVDVVSSTPGSGSSYVTGQDIERALNQHAREGWELLNILEHFSKETNSVPGIGSGPGTMLSSSTRVSVTLVFKK
jgi:hypothetical protein